jgi:hypothetical protein
MTAVRRRNGDTKYEIDAHGRIKHERVYMSLSVEMETTCSSETLVPTDQTTQCHISDDSNLYSHHRSNLARARLEHMEEAPEQTNILVNLFLCMLENLLSIA